MADSAAKGRWLIRTHHAMRVSSFATVFVAACIHLFGEGYGPLPWAFMVALLLVYPQVQYWRLLRATDPMRAAMNALVVDSFLLGAFSAAVGFSDWLTFSVVLGTMSNSAANKGWRSIGVTALALLVGALLAVAVGGLHFSPQTAWPAAVFCMAGLGAYVLAVGNIAFHRNLQLRSAREQLRVHERELLEANTTLQTSLNEIEALRKGLLEQANQDGLTQLFNRRFLDSTLEREMARCKREGKPLALIMLDIDYFKKYNDSYGHQAGDACLKAVALALQGSAKRAGDMAARYGGEEFTLVLPDTDSADAQRMAEALRLEIEALAMPHAQSDLGMVTISAGLAVMSGERYASAALLLRAADEALYYAKWGGRNRVHAAPDASHTLRPGAPVAGGQQPLTWHRAYAFGEAALDAEHAQLFHHINAVLLAISEGHPVDAVGALIDQLMRGVVAHFEHEETMLTALAYPGVADHAAQHRVLLSRAVDLVSQHRRGSLQMGDLLHFLAQDLIAKHMLMADRSYADWLKPGD